MNWLWGGIPFQSPSSDDALLTKQMLETLEPHLHFKERPPFLHGVRKIAPPWWAFWRKPRWEYVLESESATLRMQKPPSPTA